MEKYRHPILDKYAEKGRHLGHGGMDYVMDSRLVYCLQHGLPLDMDVYDMAEWCALGELALSQWTTNCCRYIPGLYPWILERSEGLVLTLMLHRNRKLHRNRMQTLTLLPKRKLLPS